MTVMLTHSRQISTRQTDRLVIICAKIARSIIATDELHRDDSPVLFITLSYLSLLLEMICCQIHLNGEPCLYYSLFMSAVSSGIQTMDPLEEDRWMDWMRLARVFSRSCRMSQPGLSGGASYSSCLNGSNSISITMFFRK